MRTVCRYRKCVGESTCVYAGTYPGCRSRGACYKESYLEVKQDLTSNVQAVSRGVEDTTEKWTVREAKLCEFDLRVFSLAERAERAGELQKCLSGEAM